MIVLSMLIPEAIMDIRQSPSYPLRLDPDVRSQLAKLAKQEGVSLNHFIELAVAEKISRTECALLLIYEDRLSNRSVYPVSRRRSLREQIMVV